ncbi:DUF2540 domain-containing protein [Methanothermococcus thermolithotrophicus]|uniref:DUF2540 domain-containing protein n=1 Tax=Methanothermococcus thermolithotrophicus TaxID=2186 RepID=UPI000375A318|nr:DUF2540 domain-containing protein [Methanothermococcus thermolithotrophicus]
MLKRFTLYKNIDSRRLRFILHQLQDLNTIDTHTLIEVSKLKKKYEKKLTLIDEEIEIVEKYGRKTNELLNYIIYMEELREEHETRHSTPVSQTQ